MLTRLLVYFAYFLKTSPRYRASKRFFYNFLENPESPVKTYFDVFMICLVMVSVFLLIHEVNSQLDEFDIVFERGVISLFIIEYLLRAWLYNDSHKIILEHYEKSEYLGLPFNLGKVLFRLMAKKFEYMLTPFAIIDLLAILPGYRSLRILRVFLIFRLFKLFRYVNSTKLFAHLIASKRLELNTLAIFLGFLLFIGTVGTYLFEYHDNGGQVKNLFDALYFSTITVSTVGYGDISPKTTGGRLITMAMIFSGVAIIAFFTSIIVSAFSERMVELRELRTYRDLNRLTDFVIICGFGRVGQHIAGQLAKNAQAFVIIDSDESKILKAKRAGFLAIHADASKNAVLKSAGIHGKATAILCTTGDDVVNVYITLTSRHLNSDIRIITTVNHHENIKKLYQAGASDVLQPFAIAGLVVAEYIGQPVAFEAILGIIGEEKQSIMETVCVAADSFIDGQKIADINFEQRKLKLIGVISSNDLHRKHKNSYQIKHQHFYFNPASDFELQKSDLIVVLGRSIGIEHFRDQIEKSRLKTELRR